MEDILKPLLEAEQKAENQVEQADSARRQMIQEALDQVRAAETEFEQQMEVRRKPFLTTAEEGAQRRIKENDAAAAAQQKILRERAAANEGAAVEAALAMILGEDQKTQ